MQRSLPLCCHLPPPLTRSRTRAQLNGVHLLLTSCQALRGVPGFGEHTHRLGPLPPVSTARLLLRLAPRVYRHADRRQLLHSLAARPEVTALAGHPGRIVQLAVRLTPEAVEALVASAENGQGVQGVQGAHGAAVIPSAMLAHAAGAETDDEAEVAAAEADAADENTAEAELTEAKAVEAETAEATESAAEIAAARD